MLTVATRLPPSTAGVTNALMVKQNTSKDPAPIPGSDNGSVTRRATRPGGAPRLSAASSSNGSMRSITPTRLRIMRGNPICTSPTVTENRLPLSGRGCAITPSAVSQVLTRPLSPSNTSQA